MGVVDHPDGRVFFVEGTVPRDEGRFEILRSKKNYGFAKIDSLSSLSSDRIEPACKLHGFDETSCCGCPWMMVDYKTQLLFKQNFVKHFIERANLLTEHTKISKIHASPREFSYRNRAEFKTNGTLLGYVNRIQKKIVDVDYCPILDEKNSNILTQLRSLLPNDNWKPVGQEAWNQIEIDSDFNLKKFKINQKRNFKQGNTAQNEWMKQWVMRILSTYCSSEERVLELFCGNGNFTRVLRSFFTQEIFSCEGSIESLRELRDANLEMVQSENIDLFKDEALSQIKKRMPNPEVLLLDPPRVGFKNLARFTWEFPTLKTLVYISCDLDSFSNDTKFIGELGWKLLEIQPIDLFPQTPHVELLTVFKR